MFSMATPPTAVGPRELERRVLDALRADPRLAQTKIDVIAHGSRIWLTGTVIGAGTAAYAEDIAKRVDGVDVIHNDLALGT